MTTIIFLNKINYYIKASYYTCMIIQSLTTVLNCQKGVVMYGKGIFIFSDINNISEHVLKCILGEKLSHIASKIM